MEVFYRRTGQELTADLRWHTYFLEMMLQDLEVRRAA